MVVQESTNFNLVLYTKQTTSPRCPSGGQREKERDVFGGGQSMNHCCCCCCVHSRVCRHSVRRKMNEWMAKLNLVSQAVERRRGGGGVFLGRSSSKNRVKGRKGKNCQAKRRGVEQWIILLLIRRIPSLIRFSLSGTRSNWRWRIEIGRLCCTRLANKNSLSALKSTFEILDN